VEKIEWSLYAAKGLQTERPSTFRRADYLKSFGLRSVRLHLLHSATFLRRPACKIVFIAISPPQSGQMNFCVATVVREFLLAPAILFLQNQFNFDCNIL